MLHQSASQPAGQQQRRRQHHLLQRRLVGVRYNEQRARCSAQQVAVGQSAAEAAAAAIFSVFFSTQFLQNKASSRLHDRTGEFTSAAWLAGWQASWPACAAKLIPATLISLAADPNYSLAASLRPPNIAAATGEQRRQW